VRLLCIAAVRYWKYLVLFLNFLRLLLLAAQ